MQLCQLNSCTCQNYHYQLGHVVAWLYTVRHLQAIVVESVDADLSLSRADCWAFLQGPGIVPREQYCQMVRHL